MGGKRAFFSLHGFFWRRKPFSRKFSGFPRRNAATATPRSTIGTTKLFLQQALFLQKIVPVKEKGFFACHDKTRGTSFPGACSLRMRGSSFGETGPWGSCQGAPFGRMVAARPPAKKRPRGCASGGCQQDL
jgi:hypothetical protein